MSAVVSSVDAPFPSHHHHHAPISPGTKPPTYLDDDMPGQSIDHDDFFPQGQRRHYLLPELLDVPLDLPYPSLVEVPAAFGEVIDGQLLRRRAVDVIGEGR